MQYREMDDDELSHECEMVFDELVVTDKKSEFLFRSTMKQSSSHLWYEHRRGRLTASKFGAICHTPLDSPSHSLIENILQQGAIPKTAAMQWGIEK